MLEKYLKEVSLRYLQYRKYRHILVDSTGQGLSHWLHSDFLQSVPRSDSISLFLVLLEQVEAESKRM